jgi:phosphatidate phosphatase APP1
LDSKFFLSSTNLGLLGSRPIKILSDLDDTLICSGGSVGNVDKRYPKGIIYPGVNAFYRELDLGPNSEHGEWPKGAYGNLAFISARPKVDELEEATYQKLSTLAAAGKLYTYPTVLCGNLRGIGGVVLRDFSSIAKKKYKNFQQYSILYPEYDFVFVGDNGQGDVLAAAHILKKYPDRLKPSFIRSKKEHLEFKKIQMMNGKRYIFLITILMRPLMLIMINLFT